MRIIHPGPHLLEVLPKKFRVNKKELARTATHCIDVYRQDRPGFRKGLEFAPGDRCFIYWECGEWVLLFEETRDFQEIDWWRLIDKIRAPKNSNATLVRMLYKRLCEYDRMMGFVAHSNIEVDSKIIQIPVDSDIFLKTLDKLPTNGGSVHEIQRVIDTYELDADIIQKALDLYHINKVMEA